MARQNRFERGTVGESKSLERNRLGRARTAVKMIRKAGLDPTGKGLKGDSLGLGGKSLRAASRGNFHLGGRTGEAMAKSAIDIAKPLSDAHKRQQRRSAKTKSMGGASKGRNRPKK